MEIVFKSKKIKERMLYSIYIDRKLHKATTNEQLAKNIYLNLLKQSK